MSEEGWLFESAAEDREDAAPRPPLAERVRPRSLEELVGQRKAVGPGSLLRDLLRSAHLPSLILWGPPGCGKTTLARLLAGRGELEFVSFSAVLSGVREVRALVEEARRRRRREGRGTLLFVDEIHRFNKAQQDAFLPHVEDGTLVLVGATTENPSFELNAALLSRCRVLVLEPLETADLIEVGRRALAEPERSGLPPDIAVDDGALEVLAEGVGGDARAFLNRLEAVVERERAMGRLGRPVIDADRARTALGDRGLRYDKSGERHFDVMSAFHKSLRGGDPQAALYWLATMLESGEDALWVARRLVRFASEDVGLADPGALQQALAAFETYRRLGSPEGELALAQAAVYLATAPKSNAVYRAYGEVRELLRREGAREVPLHLRNAPTKLMKDLGHGRDYVYPHDLEHAVSDQDHLPEALRGRRFYSPSPFGHEKEVARRMEWWERTRARLREGGPASGEGAS